MLKKTKKASLIKKFQLHKKDTGSTEVQVALLTEQIKSLIGHLKSNPKDNDSRRGLLTMVNQRKKFLKYLEENNPKKYEALKKELQLK